MVSWLKKIDDIFISKNAGYWVKSVW